MRVMLPLLPLLPLLLLLAGCSASGPIVLNEFIASNVTGVTDSTGSTPDWIELFNTSGEPVSLNGWFLSDTSGVPERAPLDGITVPASGFVLLMASGDTTRGGDHLNFRLAATGEEVVLSNSEGIVDAFSFGEQTSDVSMARVPDGDGDWVEAPPTPGESNE